MKKLLKNLFTKDVLIIVFCNFLADWYYVQAFLVLYAICLLGIDDDDNVRLFISLLIPITFVLARAFILPILYNFMEKKSKNEVVQNFISRLKNSTKFKFKTIGYIALIQFTIAFIFVFSRYFNPINIYNDIVGYLSMNYQENIFEIIFSAIQNYVEVCFSCLLMSIFFGLIFNYLALYLYWFIVDKIKKKKENSI